MNAGAADVETHVADVRDKEKMARLIVQADARDAVDLVVANAGVASGLSPGQIMETPEAVRAMMAINVTGVFNTVEPIMSLMSARRHGQLAIVGSMAGVRALPYSPAYCASKSAVHMWANCLRGALAPYNVHVSLAKRKDVIAFPFYMYLAMRFFSLFPAFIVDGVMRRFHVEVPETPERSEAL